METQKKQKTNEVPETLTPQQALAILVQGVQFAQTKGVYSLSDAELISKAVRVFTNQPEGKKDIPESVEPTAKPEAENPTPEPEAETSEAENPTPEPEAETSEVENPIPEPEAETSEAGLIDQNTELTVEEPVVSDKSSV